MRKLSNLSVAICVVLITAASFGCKKPKQESEKVDVQLIDSASIVPLDTHGTDVMKLND